MTPDVCRMTPDVCRMTPDVCRMTPDVCRAFQAVFSLLAVYETKSRVYVYVSADRARVEEKIGREPDEDHEGLQRDESGKRGVD